MAWIYKKDLNHDAIKTALLKRGAVVVDMCMIGHGVPDLWVTWKRKSFFVEVKSKYGVLTPSQKRFVKQHPDIEVNIIRSEEQANALLTAKSSKTSSLKT